MATEINCSCEITENEVTICYPPISSGGGGGITGVAPVGNVPKVATVDTGDVILTLEESSIDDLAAGLLVLKSAAGGQYVTLVVNNTDDDIEVQLSLISNNTANIYQANFFLTDQASTAGLTQDLDFLRWGYDTNGVDDIKVVIDKASKELQVLSGGEAYFNIDLTNGIYWLGDHAAVNHGTQIEVDDATELITLRASHGIETSMYSVGGVAGIDGTFEDANGLIVTVTKGIITSIV